MERCLLKTSQELSLRCDQLTQHIFLSLQPQWDFTKDRIHIWKLSRNSHLHVAAAFGTLELSEVTELEMGRLEKLRRTHFEPQAAAVAAFLVLLSTCIEISCATAEPKLHCR